MAWEKELEHILDCELSDCWLTTGACEEAKVKLFSFINDELKKSYIAGHREGAISAMQAMNPQGDILFFDDQVDKHYAEKQYQQYRKQ